MPAAMSAGPSVSFGRPTVLVADDEPAVRRVMTWMLESAGYDVLTAADGASAVALFTRHSENLRAVLLDARMPTLSGAETLSEIRRIDKGIPVLVCTGARDATIARQCMDLGASAMLVKPFNREELWACLASFPC